jgi:hypothetical protein
MAHLTMVLFRDGHGDSGDAVAALLRDVARSGAGRYSVTEVDVQARPGLAAHYHVRTTPTILLMKHGDIVDRVAEHQRGDFWTFSSTGGRSRPPRRVSIEAPVRAVCG